MRRNVKGAIAKYWSHQGYVRHCEYYLKHGDWVDDFYGEYQERQSDGEWRSRNRGRTLIIVRQEDGGNGADYRGNNPIELTID